LVVPLERGERVCLEKLEDSEGKEQEDVATEQAKLRDRDWSQEKNKERTGTREQKANKESLSIQDMIA
jgi:hypothetical protein